MATQKTGSGVGYVYYPGGNTRVRGYLAKIWKIAREWDGEVAAILGSGPSMSQEVADIVRASGCRTIAVNNQAIATAGKPALAPWADILYAADATWWMHNAKAIQAFRGKKVTIANQNGLIAHGVPTDCVAVEHGGVTGFDERPSHVKTGANSGFQALHIAMHLGARRIVLCGFDMHAKKGEHWFGDHHWRRGARSRYDLFIRYFNASAKDMLKRAEIINCTPGSALTCFPFMDLKEALNAVCSVRETKAEDFGSEAQLSGGDRTSDCAIAEIA